MNHVHFRRKVDWCHSIDKKLQNEVALLNEDSGVSQVSRNGVITDSVS